MSDPRDITQVREAADTPPLRVDTLGTPIYPWQEDNTPCIQRGED